MSSDFATPGMAFGAYMPLGQVESRGIRVAPFTIRAAVNTGVGYDDNVALRDSNKISSMFFSLSISVAVGLEGDTGYRKLRYVTNEGVSTGSDYDQFDVGGTFSYRVAPKTRALAQIGHADITHPGDASLDNTEMRYLIGAAWDALAKTRGTLRVGYMTKTFSGGSRPDLAGPSYEGGITWSPRTYSVVDLSARRVFSESYETGADFVVNNVGSLTWNHVWEGGIRSTLNYVYNQISVEGIDREDKYQNFGVRVSYGLSRAVRVGAELRHDTRDSATSRSTTSVT